MSDELSTTSSGLRKRLDESEVLLGTVLQLRKDLAADEVPLPKVGEGAFEELRAAVLTCLEQGQRAGIISRAINRVDLTERMVQAAMDRGGLPELAGVMVLRCLQKVLIRKHFSGAAGAGD